MTDTSNATTSANNTKKIRKNSSLTKIPWFSNTYHWTVQGYQTGFMFQHITSHAFRTYIDGDRNGVECEGITFWMCLDPKGGAQSPDVDTLYLYLTNKENMDEKMRAECEITIGKELGPVATVYNGIHTFHLGDANVLGGLEIPMGADNARLLQDGEFTVSCRVEHPGLASQVTASQKVVGSNMYRDYSTIAQDIQPAMYRMYQDGTLTDIQIRVDGETVNAHKVILAANSPVFKAMLQGDYKECDTNVIKIDDVSKTAFLTIMNFLYGAKIKPADIAYDIISDMLNAAEKYEIMKLKKVCEAEMIRKVTIDNVLDVLQICDVYGTDRLETHCCSFIDSNKAVIHNSDKWKDLVNEHPHIIIKYFTKPL